MGKIRDSSKVIHFVSHDVTKERENLILESRTCDVKTMSYIVFISHSLHWRYIKTALHEYVINIDISW